MSKASEYAAACKVAEGKGTYLAVGGITFLVTPEGALSMGAFAAPSAFPGLAGIIGSSSSQMYRLQPEQALQLGNWLLSTFGEKA